MRRLVLALGALLFIGCSSSPSTPGPNDGASLNFESKATIVVDDAGIRPALTEARVGQAITVTNGGTTDHGLTSETIDTGTLRPGESTTVFLTATGTVVVRDRFEPTHTARIEVAAETRS
jgi:hypothetical protein